MITKFIFGKPYDTDAVILDIPHGARLPQYITALSEDGGVRFRCNLYPDDIVYGLGESMRGINKRGGRYVSFNADEPRQDVNTPSLYGAHNFLIVDGVKTFGLFFDTPARVIFEIDYKASGEISVLCENGNLNFYVIEEEPAHSVVKTFLSMIGRSYIPPLWAFGYGQSRWGYKCERDVEKVVRGYEKADMPLDYVCLDIDYMDRYIDFTVNRKRFPDFSGFVSKMRREGIHLVPIVDAGIKVEPGNAVYEEGVRDNYFCTNESGKNFQAAVWPGMTHLPDFLRPEVREWFGKQYKVYTDCGIDGFWNDMNEPAMFYSEYSKNRPRRERKREDPLYVANGWFSDYKRFYHNVGEKSVLHYDVHNVYGYNMTRGTSEQLEKLLDKRFFLISRSSYIGSHRYGGIWTGDNRARWADLRQNVLQMPSLNMCGLLFSGADTGGFNGIAGRELLLRWLAVSVFTPLMRNHCAKYMNRRECYRFWRRGDFRSILSLRYKLLPYIYSEYIKAAMNGDMYIQPLAFGYPEDKQARHIEDQLLVGGSIMITPVLEKGKTTRSVYLPEDMTMVSYNGQAFSCMTKKAGKHEISVKLNEVVFFIRKGKLLPVGNGARNTATLDLTDVKLLGDGYEYRLYADDGYTRNITRDNIVVLKK